MQEKIHIDVPSLNIGEIVETEAFYYEDDPNVWYVVCEPKEEWSRCTECYSSNIISYGTGAERRIHDISIGIKSVDIILRTQRYHCKSCGKTFRRPYNFVDENKWITKRLKDSIRLKTLSQPFKQVAEEFGMTIPTISDIFKGYGEELDKKRKLVAPRVLGIDENHIGHKMRGVFTDIEGGVLLELTEDNKSETMQKAIESMEGYDENVEFVCMDMTRGYKSVIMLCMPKAKIVVDKFHVVRYIYTATEKARKQIFAKLKKQVADLPEGPEKEEKQALLRRLGKDSYLFKFSSKRVVTDASRTSLLARLCQTFPELNELRIVKMRAEKIYNDSSDQFEAAENINDFIRNIPPGEEYDDFRAFSRTLNNWMPEILNYFKYGKQYTNAATEGVNALIKQLNGVGRGYSFEILRAKALYWSEAHNRPVKARKKPQVRPQPKDPQMINKIDFFDPMKLGEKLDDWEYESGDSSSIATLLRRFDEIF